MAFFHKIRTALPVLLALLFSASVGAEELQYNMREGVTEISQGVYDLHMLVTWICVGIGVVVFGAMFYAMFAHRRSKNPEPAKFSHNTLVEVVWTAIPFLILVVLAVPAVRLLVAMEDTSESEVTVQITGYQWKWHYKYLDQDIEFFSNLATPRSEIEHYEGEGKPSDPNYLLDVDNRVVLPVGKKIRFLITADDVLHAWWIPDFAVKKDAIPGFINEAWTKVDEPGIYRGQCAELCGKDHGFMPIVVEVVSEEDFDAWIQSKYDEQAEAERLAAEAASKSWSKEDLMSQGEQAYNTYCAACHKVDGTGTPPVFPGMIDSPITTGPVEAHISIVVNGKAGTAMQAFGAQLTDAELAAIITYERNAWGIDTGDLVQPADIAAFKAGN